MTEEEFIAGITQKVTEIGDLMMEYYDFCHIVEGSCRAGDDNPCCLGPTIFGRGKCSFLIGNACTNKNCDCTLWICETAINSSDEHGLAGLKLLEKLAAHYGLIRPPFIGQAYIGADKRQK